MEAVKKVTGFALLEILFAVAVLVILGGGGALYTREMRQQKSIMQVGLGAEKKAQELKKQIEAQQKSLYKDVIAPNSPKSGKTICTQEAKLCPDGKTYVGRTGPNCEFAACPTSAGGQIDRTNSQEVLKEVSRLLKMGDIESAKKYLSGRAEKLSKLNSATADQLLDLSDYFAGAVLVEDIGDIRVYKSFLRAKGTAGGEVTFRMERDSKREWWIDF